MGLFTPSVPKSVYDDLLARFDALSERYHALRLAGGALREAPLVATAPAPSPEERVRLEAADEYERNVVSAMIAEGKSDFEAHAIAKQLRQGVMDLSPVPFDG